MVLPIDGKWQCARNKQYGPDDIASFRVAGWPTGVRVARRPIAAGCLQKLRLAGIALERAVSRNLTAEPRI